MMFAESYHVSIVSEYLLNNRKNLKTETDGMHANLNTVNYTEACLKNDILMI